MGESRTRAPVLLVEDDNSVREALAMFIEHAGYNVECARNGREALACLQAGLQPSLILLDYYMPIMSGRTFRVTQLSLGIQADVPVILYSSASTIDAVDLKVQAVVPKLDINNLLIQVKRAIDG